MIRIRTRAIPAIAAFLFFFPFAFPQQPPQIRSSSELVLVPVEVHRHGEHVSGLTRDQFTILQDGQSQKVAVFEEVRTSTQRLSESKLVPGEFTNELRGDAGNARYTIIALDRINTTARDMNRAREGLKKFFEKALAAQEPVRLIAVLPDSIQMIQDFTTNSELLSAALARTQTGSGQVKQDSIFLNQNLQEYLLLGGSNLNRADAIKHFEQAGIQFQERSRRINSLDALRMVALSLAGLPGRKSLVWASSGYSFNSLTEEPTPLPDMLKLPASIPSPDRTSLNFSNVVEATALDQYTTHLLNTAGIAVYPVDLRGTVNTVYEAITPDRKYSPTRSERTFIQDKNQEIVTSLVNLAVATGGKPCYAREDVSGCFFDAMDDARDYYMAGFYVEREKIKPGWHKLAVKVAQRGVEVRARGGFLYSDLSPDQLKSADLSLEAGSRFVNPGLPFRGRWAAMLKDGDSRSVRLELTLANEAQLVSSEEPRLNLEIAAVARRSDGTVAAQFAQHVERTLPPEEIAHIRQEGMSYTNNLHLNAGRYAVRIVIRENNSGRMGSLTTMLTVD